MPIVRTCFESAIYAAWIQQHGEAAVEAYLYERARVNRTVIEQCDKAGVPVPDEVRDAVMMAPQLSLHPTPQEKGTTIKAQARNFDRACRSLLGGNAVYLTYKLLSDETHGSIGLVRHLVRGPNDELVAVKQPDHGEGAHVAAASLVASSLVWAGRALSEVGMHKPNKQLLRTAARQLGILHILVKV